MAEIALTGLEKSFGQTRVLNGIDLTIADGEFLTLVGPSGCGKSTLLRIIAGLEAQDSGHISIGPRSVDGVRASDRNLSMVFQSYALYPHLTVAENIAVPLRMRRMNGWQRLPLVGGFVPGTRARQREIDAAVQEAATMLDITHLMARKPGQLSGGQRQRVAVGRALVRDPEAFLLDEPLSNLDAKLRIHMRSEIAQLHRRLGTTFVYVTHDQAEAMTMSDRIVVMMDGELLQVGPPDEVYNRPTDIRVAEFIGSPKINILPAARDAAGTVSVLGHPTPLVAEGERPVAAVGIRPEATLVATGDAGIGGQVQHLENMGPEVFVYVALPGQASPVVAKTIPAMARQIRIGDPIALDFDHAAALAFDADGKAVPIVERAAPRNVPRAAVNG